MAVSFVSDLRLRVCGACQVLWTEHFAAWKPQRREEVCGWGVTLGPELLMLELFSFQTLILRGPIHLMWGSEPLGVLSVGCYLTNLAPEVSSL